ncbi:MAG TPA: IS110 family transposase [Armatimonadota bacterium]|nr:IS110 family transposase [Armatimonadota bacterium]
MGNGTFVGLDVHARSVVAGLIDERTGEVRAVRAPHTTDELVGWLGTLAGPVRATYEAGPTGYGLARALEDAGIACLVAAPGRIPRASGDRVKNDRRDAERLARLLRAGELVAVAVPTVADEGARDLVRAREDARADLMRARHRLSKMLLRYGRIYDRTAWTLTHDAWLRRQRLCEPAAQAALIDYYDAALQAAMRRDRLDGAITELAQRPDLAPLVRRLSCLRGVSTLTAVGLAVEIGDWHRLSGATIGSYLGLTPSESQSGARHTRGPITKTGNGHARRLLVEAAWHHRRAHRTSAELERRREGARPEVRVRAEAAGVRLHRRWTSLESRRGLRSSVVAVAVARELAGWCWSLAVMDD